MRKISSIFLGEEKIQVVEIPERPQIINVGLSVNGKVPRIVVMSDTNDARACAKYHVYIVSDKDSQLLDDYLGQYIGTYQKEGSDFFLFMNKIGP